MTQPRTSPQGVVCNLVVATFDVDGQKTPLVRALGFDLFLDVPFVEVLAPPGDLILVVGSSDHDAILRHRCVGHGPHATPGL